MITNERQYQITKAQAAKFREALASEPAKGLHPKAIKAMRDGAQSQLAELEEQLAEYEAMRAGTLVSFEVESIVGIGEALIKGRIIRNLTQKALAERMSLAEQQIQTLRGHALRRRFNRAPANGGQCAETARQRSRHA